MPKVCIEFELRKPTTEYFNYTTDADKLIIALRDTIRQEEKEGRPWLDENVLRMKFV